MSKLTELFPVLAYRTMWSDGSSYEIRRMPADDPGHPRVLYACITPPEGKELAAPTTHESRDAHGAHFLPVVAQMATELAAASAPVGICTVYDFAKATFTVPIVQLLNKPGVFVNPHVRLSLYRKPASATQHVVGRADLAYAVLAGSMTRGNTLFTEFDTDEQAIAHITVFAANPVSFRLPAEPRQ